MVREFKPHRLCQYGVVTERLMVLVLKTRGGETSVGSNPTYSSKYKELEFSSSFFFKKFDKNEKIMYNIYVS